MWNVCNGNFLQYNTSVLVWQVAFGKQKKEGKKERINEGMNKWRNKRERNRKIMGKLLSEGPNSHSYTSKKQTFCQVGTIQPSQWLKKPLGSRRSSFFNLFSNLLKPV